MIQWVRGARTVRDSHWLAPKTNVHGVRQDSAGFGLPLAIAMGLIILLIGITMVIRSFNDKVTASTQKQTANSFAIAEGGLSRTLSLLNSSFQPFLKLSYDPINPSTGRTYLGSNGIANDGDEGTTAVDDWSSLPAPPPCIDLRNLSKTLLQGNIGGAATNNYQVLAYRYDASARIGTLLVRGQESNSEAVTLIQQTMQIEERRSSNPADFPGLMAQEIDLKNNDVLGSVAGNVLCTNLTHCSIPDPSTHCLDGRPNRQALLAAIGAKRNSEVQGQIWVREVKWPPLPSIPPSAPTPIAITDTTTLSPPTDSSDPYSYVVSSIQLRGNKTLTIDTSTRPVYLFLTGDLILSGRAAIIHTGSPERFRVYGNPEDADNGNDQTITLNGGSSTTSGFIYAPDARAGINGGSSTPDFRGAIWIKTWDGSASNRAEIEVPNEMAQLLGPTFSNWIVGVQFGPSTRWERKAAS